MPDFDTDSSMMRRQQDKDTPENIEADENHARREKSDVDEASRKDREASKDGSAQRKREQMDQILHENTLARNGSPQQSGETHADNQKRGKAGDSGLAGKGRSRLGN